MKKALQLLFTTATFATAIAAHAATTIDTGTFSLKQNYWHQGNVDMRIVSQTANSVQILMGNLRPEYPIRITDTDYYFPTGWEFGGGSLLGTVKQGFRITSMALSGTITGTLEIAPLEPYCDLPNIGCRIGTATNSASVSWQVEQGGKSTSLPVLNRTDITQTETFDVTSSLSLGGEFSLGLGTGITAAAVAGKVYITTGDQTGSRYIPTTASVDFVGPVLLTVQVAPVPEPGTYAMVLAGLGLLGGVAFRQRR